MEGGGGREGGDEGGRRGNLFTAAVHSATVPAPSTLPIPVKIFPRGFG